MSIFRLADLLAHKYELVSEGASLQDTLRDVEGKLKDAYNNYIDLKVSKSKAYVAIPILAHQGEPHCQKIVGHMQFILANIKTLIAKPVRLFKALNKVLALISSLDETIKNTKKKSPEHLPDHPTLNMGHNDLSRLENSLKRFSSLIVTAAQKLQPIAVELAKVETEEGEEPEDFSLQGNIVVPEAKPLTRNEIRDFFLMYPNEAAAYGFTGDDSQENLDIISALIEEQGMSREFGKFVRAIKGKGNPDNGNLIRQMANSINNALRARKQTNFPAL